MIDSVFLVSSIREKHQKAPLLVERERYLAYLFEIGTRRERVRNVATMLLHIVRLLQLDSPRLVGIDEILQGSKRWVDDPGAYRHRRASLSSAYTFQLVATNWLRYQGSLIVAPKPKPYFHNLLSQFLNDMHTQRGLTLETIRCYRSRVMAFLNWLQPRCAEFSSVRPIDIEEFLEAKRVDGWARSSIAGLCHALRTFFGYAELQGWCSSGIQSSIRSPRVPRIAEYLNVPVWEDVRRVIASIGSLKPSDLRAKAMFLLFSIYGFRSAEVRSLTLDDIDWRRELITVRRAKRGKTQQFPLQGEVGDAIALYLQKMRPRCSCRNVFVTLHPPYRPVLGHTMSSIIGPRMKMLGIATEHFGPHMLRHACATQLLKTGSSLKDIADFLGHSDLRSVSNYVKCDSRSLKKVAEFSLRGVL
jgi:site-specific recombinase XerD